jgi:preprotein translocase subunit SecD
MARYRTLIFIIALIVVAAWIVNPSNPGIRFGSYRRSIETRLGLDLVGGVQALLEADLPQGQTVDSDKMRTAKAIVENRVNGLGVTEAVVQQAGDRRIVVELPGISDPEEAIGIIKETGLLEFVDMGDNPVPEGSVVQTDFVASAGTGGAPAPTSGISGSTEVAPTPAPGATSETPPAQPERILHTVMTGEVLKTVEVQTNRAGQYVVAFTLTPEGSKVFADYTSRNVGKYLGIVLDKEVISAPVVKSAITQGEGVIEGSFTAETANALAVQLRYGSLPIPLKVITSSTVGPTLGQASLQKSLIAGIIGLSAVILFMGLFYRLPGVIADLALLIYALVTFALFKFIPVTLTLPGIAGFVLSIGVAVDANILIFERLKEELRSGKTLRQAIDLGWGRAWPSIRDSNLSTLITCAILFWFGSTYGASIVKGFSLTLAVGVMVSMFTAIIVTRTILHLILDNIEFRSHHRLFGL